jgi:hypothetical protein
VIGQPPRYALAEPVFPFPALVAAAGRATLGGPREIALACLMSARLASALVGGLHLSAEQKKDRADRARHWVGALSLPVGIRAAALAVVDATGRGDIDAAGAGLDRLLAASATTLDQSSRSELNTLGDRLLRASELQAS